MKARGQLLSAFLVLVLVAGGGTYLQREVGPRAPAAGPPGVAPSGAWFCPHGGGPSDQTSGWEVTLEIANPGAVPVGVSVLTIGATKLAEPQAFTVPAGGEIGVPVDASERGDASMVRYFGGWVAAGWVAHAGGGEGGVAAEPCLPSAAKHWLLPDGTTALNQDAYAVIMNPFAAPAVFSVTLYNDDRPAPVNTDDLTDVKLKPNHSVAIGLNSALLDAQTVSARIDASIGRVAAASLGVDETGGIRSSVGVPFPLPHRVILPGGFDQGRTELVLSNPVPEKVGVGGTIFGRDSEEIVASLQDASLGPESAATFAANSDGPSTVIVVPASTEASGGPGIAAARRTFGVASDQGSTTGASDPASAWVVLPAVAGSPSHPGMVLSNPGSQPVAVTLSFLPGPDVGSPPAPVTVTVPAGRTVGAPKDFLDAAPTAAVLAVSDGGTFVPAAASYSLGLEGIAAFAVALGVPIPDAWIPA